MQGDEQPYLDARTVEGTPEADEMRNWDDERDDGSQWDQEDGELLPTALREQAPRENQAPTPIPEGGFPPIHRDDPESMLRGMAVDWMREVWSDAPNTDVFVQVFNYRYSEDDVLNGRIAENLRWAFEQLSGEQGFDVVPPEPEDSTAARSRTLPSIWVIRGLSPRATTHAIARGYWSFPTISFAALPRTAPMQSWLFTLEGFLEGNEEKIRAAIMRTLMEDEMQQWLMTMLATHPAYEGRSIRRALTETLQSLRVETMQLSNGTHLASVFIRPPTRSLREWRRWVAELRTRRYRSFAIGTGRVRNVAQCAGCTSVAHLTHLCPFPRIPGWNGPNAGEGVFGRRNTRTRTSRTSASQANRRDNAPASGRRRDNRDRRGGYGDRSQHGTPGPRRNGRNERHRRSDRDDRDSRSDRENQDPTRGHGRNRRGNGYGGQGSGSGRDRRFLY